MPLFSAVKVAELRPGTRVASVVWRNWSAFKHEQEHVFDGKLNGHL